MRLVWLKNETRAALRYWSLRGELPDHIFRKPYQRRWYDVDRVVIGMPRAAPTLSQRQLVERGVLGVYGWRYDQERRP